MAKYTLALIQEIALEYLSPFLIIIIIYNHYYFYTFIAQNIWSNKAKVNGIKKLNEQWNTAKNLQCDWWYLIEVINSKIWKLYERLK